MEPKHRKSCAYLKDFRSRCTCGCKVLGKPFSHWQEMADSIVMRVLLGAAHQYDSPLNGLPTRLARTQLLALAENMDPELKVKIEQERDQCVAGLNRALSVMLGK